MRLKNLLSLSFLGLFISFLLVFIWLYTTHDLVRWYFWPRQGTSVAMWKGKDLGQYKSLGLYWSHGQSWDSNGERTTLWHWPTIRWTNVDFRSLARLEGK